MSPTRRCVFQHWTSIDIGLKPNLDNPAVEALLIVRAQFSKKSLGSLAAGVQVPPCRHILIIADRCAPPSLRI